MNWEAISAIGEMVGALAVVISIVYLAVQIRGNTRVDKARASFDATHSWADATDLFLQLPDETLEPLANTLRADFNAEAVSDLQYHRVTAFWRAVGQKLEGQYYLFKFGLVEPDIWAKRSSILKGITELPFGAAWWQGELEAATYSEEFVTAIEKTIGIDATAINRRPI